MTDHRHPIHVRCPYCQARPGKPCRTDDNTPATRPHARRIRLAGWCPACHATITTHTPESVTPR